MRSACAAAAMLPAVAGCSQTPKVETDPETGVHPWHIHEGSCGDPSPPIVGPAAAYPPLNVGSGGTVGTIVACGVQDD